MTPRIRRPKSNKVKEGEPQDSQLAADYRFWISFQGSRSSELLGESASEDKRRSQVKNRQGTD